MINDEMNELYGKRVDHSRVSVFVTVGKSIFMMIYVSQNHNKVVFISSTSCGS